jgi:hypothetical protein
VNIPDIVMQKFPFAAKIPKLSSGQRVKVEFPQGMCAVGTDPQGHYVVRVVWFRHEGYDDDGENGSGAGSGSVRQVINSRAYDNYCQELFTDLANAITATLGRGPQSWRPL